MPGFEAEGGTPVIAAAGGYMASNGKVEIWGQVVEKAFAKFCGPYSNTEYTRPLLQPLLLKGPHGFLVIVSITGHWYYMHCSSSQVLWVTHVHAFDS